MKINFYGVMSSRKVDALIKLSGAHVVEDAECWWVNGNPYKSYPEVGHHILADVNFFIENGDVRIDLEAVKAAKDSKGFKMFFIEE